jgi:GNAT superfamily N-acetyltransferase
MMVTTPDTAVRIRTTLQPGDIGWIVKRHGEIYAEEFGWNIELEAMAARAIGGFVESFDPSGECCWIAELNGERVGYVMLVRESDTVGKLRTLLVDPSARSHGIGTHLVNACLHRARELGYSTVVLWTMTNLTDARRIYDRVGFRIVTSAPLNAFGHELTEEIWSIDL